MNLICTFKATGNNTADTRYKFYPLQTGIQRIESSVKIEIATNRKETFEQSALARKELQQSLQSFEEKLNHLTNTIDLKLTSFSDSNNNNATASRKEIKEALDSFKKDLAQSIDQFNSLQKDNFFALLNKQSEQNTNTGNSLDSMRQTLEKKLAEMQTVTKRRVHQLHSFAGRLALEVNRIEVM